jgi:hypothetical protein
MLERQEEVSDVEIVLKDTGPAGNSKAVDALRAHGLHVTDVDDADGVVEGTISADRVEELKRLPCVAYLRDVFTYVAEEDSDVEQPEGGH